MKKFEKRIKEDLDDLGLTDVVLVIETIPPNKESLLSIRWIKDGSLVENTFDHATDEFKIYQMVELDNILRFLEDKIIVYSNNEVTIKEKKACGIKS